MLMVLFAAMTIATATAMIRGRRKTGDEGRARQDGEISLSRIIVDGQLVGLAAGLVGAGGGFLIVPALNLLAGLPMAVAVATSLLVIVMNSGAGLAGHLFSTSLDWTVLIAFTGPSGFRVR